MLSDELKAKLDNYCKLLENEMIKEYPDCASLHYKYTYNLGKKFIKVICCGANYGDQRYVWCFVDYEGNLYKAEGWKKPAKGIRGHIDNPILNGYDFYKRY